MELLAAVRDQYFALVPPRLVHLPPLAHSASPSGQQYLIDCLLDETRWPQPEDGYRRSFWRVILRRFEAGLDELQGGIASVGAGGSDDLEIDERFYELLSGLMVDAGPSDQAMYEPRQSHRTFIYNQLAASQYAPGKVPADSRARAASATSEATERFITLLEEQTVLQGGTTGLRTWTAALHLGHHILHRPDALFPCRLAGDSTTVLELGAGTGFLSCLLAQQGWKVTASDLGEVSGGLSPLERLRHNVGLNGLEQEVMVRDLDWMDAEKQPGERASVWQELEAEPPDVIVAADVIYDPDLIPPLVATLRILLAGPRRAGQMDKDRRCAIIAATVRNPATLDSFVECCSRSALGVQELDLPAIDPSAPTFWDSGLDASVPVRIMRVVAT